MKKIKKKQKRSSRSEIVEWLENGVCQQRAVYDQKKLLADIQKRREKKKLKPGIPDSVTLLREDRER